MSGLRESKATLSSFVLRQSSMALQKAYKHTQQARVARGLQAAVGECHEVAGDAGVSAQHAERLAGNRMRRVQFSLPFGRGW